MSPHSITHSLYAQKKKQSEIFSNNHALDRENNTVRFNIS